MTDHAHHSLPNRLLGPDALTVALHAFDSVRVPAVTLHLDALTDIDAPGALSLAVAIQRHLAQHPTTADIHLTAPHDERALRAVHSKLSPLPAQARFTCEAPSTLSPVVIAAVDLPNAAAVKLHSQTLETSPLARELLNGAHADLAAAFEEMLSDARRLSPKNALTPMAILERPDHTEDLTLVCWHEMARMADAGPDARALEARLRRDDANFSGVAALPKPLDAAGKLVEASIASGSGRAQFVDGDWCVTSAPQEVPGAMTILTLRNERPRSAGG